MALFKILKGNEANLPSTKHEGWAYVTEKGNMYVDLSNDKRVKIGNRADTAEYADKATGDTQTIRSRYLARIKQVTSDGTQFTFRGETGDGTNAPDLISIPMAGDKAGLVSNAAQTIKGEKTFANGIKFPNVTSTTYPAVSAGLTWSGSTDGAKIYYEVQASDKGMLIIEARDDTNAGAIFRNSNSKKEVSIINGLVTGAFKGNLSGTASHATSDANGKNIASYVASVLAQSDNRTIRVTKGDGTTNDVKLYFAASSSFGGAANSANVLNINNTESIGVGRMQFFQKSGDATLMPDTNWWSLVRLQHGGYASTGYWTEMAYAFHSDTIKFRRNQNGTKSEWKTIAFTDGTIAKATQAEKDWLGQVIDETYMKYPLSIKGEVITMTRGDGVSSTITVPDTKVTQSETTTSNYRPIILGYTNTTDTTKLSASTRNQVYASNKFYAQPSTGTLVATTFKGALDGNAKTATNAEFAEKAKGDTQSIQSKYVSSVLKKSGSNYVLRITKGDGTYNDVGLYFAASSSCGGPANSANLLNTLGSKGSNSTTTGTYTKFATVNVSAGAWVNNSIFMFVSDAEANNFSGLIRIHFRSSSTIASTSISMYWLTISNRSYAGDMYAVKTADGVYDLYWYNRSKYTSLNFSVIRGGSANISFVSNSTVSSITAAAQSSLGGQVNYANSAGSATNDSAGENIRSTYISSIKQVTSNGTTFTFRGKSGDGTDRPDLISIPAASTTTAGLVTNAAQTFAGVKTFNNNIYVKGKVTIDLNGNKVEIGSDNKTYFHFLVRGQATNPLTFWFGGPIQTAGNITPHSNDTYWLGTSGNKWKGAYFGSGGITVGGTIIDKESNELKASLFVHNIYAKTSNGSSFIIGGKNTAGDEITTLTIPAATTSKAGLVTNGAQTWAGNKTLNNDLYIEGKVAVSASSANGYNLYVNGTSYFVKDARFKTEIYLEARGADRLLYSDSNRKIMTGSHYANSTQVGINTTNIADISSYNLFVEGTTKFNGNTTHNGAVYFSNGTVYYINNDADARLRYVGVGTSAPDSKYALKAGGAVYIVGVTTHAGNVIPEATNTRSLGVSGTRWSKVFIGTADTYGSATQPIYWNAGVPKATTYSLKATVNNGSAYRLAYYSTATAISQTGHYANTTQIGINITNTTTIGSNALYVNGTACFSDAVKIQGGHSLTCGPIYCDNVHCNDIDNSGYLHVSGSSTFGMPATFSDGVTMNDTLKINGSLTCNTKVTINGSLNVNNNALLRKIYINGVNTKTGFINWGTPSSAYNSGFTMGGLTGLCISQNGNETSGMQLNGDYIVMWSPADSYCLRYFDEDSGSEIWNINSSGTFSGTAAKSNNLTIGSATHWYNVTGVVCRKYEGQNTSTYRLPTGYDIVFGMNQGSNRGAAFSVDWRDGCNNVYFNTLHDDTSAWGWTGWRRIWVQGNSVTSAVWNDYAECRKSDSQEPGYVMFEKGDDTLSKTIERLQHFAGIVSDTWGFSQGETADAKTNIAVAGRVLAYPYRDRNEYKPGDCVCAAPGGKVDIMTREEIVQYPDRIVGTVSCVPEYEEWGGGEGADRDPVKVNGRIWIKVK